MQLHAITLAFINTRPGTRDPRRAQDNTKERGSDRAKERGGNRMKRLSEGEFIDMFFGNPPEKDDFHLALDRILENIDKVIQIPLDKRTYDL